MNEPTETNTSHPAQQQQPTHQTASASCLPPFTLVFVLLLFLSIATAVSVAVAVTVSGNKGLVRDKAEDEQLRSAVTLTGVIYERLVSAEITAQDFSLKVASGVLQIPQGSGWNSSADRQFMLSMAAELKVNEARIGGSFIRTPDNRVFGVFIRSTHSGYTLHYTCANGTLLVFEWFFESLTTGPFSEEPFYNFTMNVPANWYHTASNLSIPDNVGWVESFGVWQTFSISTWSQFGPGPRQPLTTTGVQLHLKTVGQLLRDTPVTGVAFLVDARAEKIIGCNDPNVVLLNTYVNTDSLTLPTNATFNDTLIFTAVRDIRRRWGSFQANLSVTPFWSPEKDVVISLNQIVLHSQRWIVVLVDRPKMATVDGPMLGATIGTTLLFTVLAAAFGWWMMRPLKFLSSNMRAISRLEFDQTKSTGKSWIREMRQMQRSFELLKGGTEALTKIVPPDAAKLLMDGGAVMAEEDTSAAQQSTQMDSFHASSSHSVKGVDSLGDSHLAPTPLEGQTVPTGGERYQFWGTGPDHRSVLLQSPPVLPNTSAPPQT